MAELGSGMKCIRVLLIIFNVLFWLIGLLIIIGASVVYVKINNFQTFVGTTVSAGVIAIICVGIVIFIVAFFGCFGAWKENVCMIKTFAILLIILLIFEFAAAIAAFVLRNQISGFLDETIKSAMDQYEAKDDYKEAVDGLQSNFSCCGATNYSDWSTSNNTQYKNGKLPPSCCQDESQQCSTANKTNVHSKGCSVALTDYSTTEVAIIAGCALGVCLIEIIGIVLAFCLARSIDNYESV